MVESAAVYRLADPGGSNCEAGQEKGCKDLKFKNFGSAPRFRGFISGPSRDRIDSENETD